MAHVFQNIQNVINNNYIIIIVLQMVGAKQTKTYNKCTWTNVVLPIKPNLFGDVLVNVDLLVCLSSLLTVS